MVPRFCGEAFTGRLSVFMAGFYLMQNLDDKTI